MKGLRRPIGRGLGLKASAVCNRPAPYPQLKGVVALVFIQLLPELPDQANHVKQTLITMEGENFQVKNKVKPRL